MKKHLVLTLSLSLLWSSAANTQVRYGLKGGLQLSHIVIAPENTQITTPVSPTFFVGGLAEYEPTKELLLTAGLQFSTVASQLEQEDLYFSSSDRASMLSVQIPATIQYQYRGFSAGGGFYVSEALFGRQVSKFTYTGQTSEDRRDLVFGNDEDAQSRRLDYGAVAEAGYSFRNVKLSAHYWFGLANTRPEFYANNGESRKNRAFGASLTYFLGAGE